jgi:hypothetical protein
VGVRTSSVSPPFPESLYAFHTLLFSSLTLTHTSLRLCSRLPQDLTPLLTSLLPVCSRETCPEMKAAEWVYLCVAHPVLGPGGSSGAGGGNGGMSSEVSSGFSGKVIVFWRDVAEVLANLLCRVGRVVLRSIIFCIRESRFRSYAFPPRYSGAANKFGKRQTS